jgi:ABC-type transport system involved in cytochrome c biogenesis permease subunit
MKYYAAIGTVGALGVTCLIACLWTWRRPAALLLHLGFALVLGGWTYNELAGVPDGYLKLHAGRTGSVDGDFEFTLDRFEIDRWPDTGTVRQYTSHGRIGGEKVDISVNHPLVRDGWWVYQSSFEEMENPHTGEPFYFTILQCVKDAGLPLVAIGGVLLLAGALWLAFATPKWRGSQDGCRAVAKNALSPSTLHLSPFTFHLSLLYLLAFLGALAMLVHRTVATGHPPLQNMYEFLMCMAALIPVLTFVSAKVDGQNTLLVDSMLLAVVMIPVGFVMDGSVKRLMPALQSPFFVPHVGAYVFGYVLLVRAALGAGRRLVGAGFFLLTLGLVLGAAWGKVCWGHWWQFDPKEMWSLATWFVYVAYFHVRSRLSEKGDRIFLAVGAVMIVLTLTWINLSKVFTGMHSYA